MDSGDVSIKQGVTKLGWRTAAVTNIDSGDVSIKQGVTKLGRRTAAVAICYQGTFLPTKGHRTWPENCYCGHLLSGDVSVKQGVTKLGRRTAAVTNIDSGDVSTKQGVTKLGRRTPVLSNFYQVKLLPNKRSPIVAGELLL